MRHAQSDHCLHDWIQETSLSASSEKITQVNGALCTAAGILTSVPGFLHSGRHVMFIPAPAAMERWRKRLFFKNPSCISQPLIGLGGTSAYFLLGFRRSIFRKAQRGRTFRGHMPSWQLQSNEEPAASSCAWLAKGNSVKPMTSSPKVLLLVMVTSCVAHEGRERLRFGNWMYN